MIATYLLAGLLAALSVGGAERPIEVRPGPPPPEVVQSSDTIEATRMIVEKVAPYFHVVGGLDPHPHPDESRWGTICEADRGQVCFGGDPEREKCPPGERCHPEGRMADLMESLYDAARAHPHAGWIVGYATYTFARFERLAEAREIAYGCRSAEAWLCRILQGHAHYAAEDLDLAEERFRAGFEQAPDSIRCDFTSAERVAGSDARQRLERLSCEDRLAPSDTIWWLADPLFARSGNDRWVEHVNRVLRARFRLTARGSNWSDPSDVPIAAHRNAAARERTWNGRIPRGIWDSWERFPDRMPQYRLWTGIQAARYHFVPDFEGGDLERPVWRLHAELDDEGYTPPYGTFHELPTQIARFRNTDAEGDSLRVAVAGTLAGTEMTGSTGAEPHLVFSDAPESFPVHLTGELTGDRAVFLAAGPAERFVLSYEVLGDEQFARHRVMLEPLRTEGVGVSDVLLYRPDEGEPPETLEAAAERMLGAPVIRPGEELGVYWETYGATEGTPVDIEVEIEGTDRGFFSRLRGLLPGGRGGGTVRLAWTEPAPGEVFPRGVVLEPGELDPGSYTLLIRVAWEGREPFELRREFEVR